MTSWPKHPVIYEINTWVWLRELARKYGRPITLGNVPDAEWELPVRLHMDAVWLMGVWERSPAGVAIALANRTLQEDFRRALPDVRREDIVGSPYCVRRYEVDPALGGREGLAAARRALAERGIRLMLDFVPNHVAPDHPWVSEHPEYFIGGSEEDLRRDPASFRKVNGNILACGRDPFFPAWPDVLQLNAFNPGLRKAAAATLSSIADQSDGVRCDMSMLMMNTIFSRTWGNRAGTPPETDYWPEAIKAVRRNQPDFLFMAEAYWDLEWELQQQGFDYCYDKRLYDRLEHDNAESVRLHLLADLSYQEKLVRFIENHDEPRAAATFLPSKERAAAVTVFIQVGAGLLHEGQREGRKVRLPVFLARRPDEDVDADLRNFYDRLFTVLAEKGIRRGEWRLCDRTGWPDNSSFQNLAAWCWRDGEKKHVIVVNLSGARSQARIHLPWDDLSNQSWQLEDLFSGEKYRDNGNELQSEGLFVDLEPWGYHLLEAQRAGAFVPERVMQTR
jgi:hypothetical protein